VCAFNMTDPLALASAFGATGALPSAGALPDAAANGGASADAPLNALLVPAELAEAVGVALATGFTLLAEQLEALLPPATGGSGRRLQQGSARVADTLRLCACQEDEALCRFETFLTPTQC
jgi:hypothetical protein